MPLCGELTHTHRARADSRSMPHEGSLERGIRGRWLRPRGSRKRPCQLDSACTKPSGGRAKSPFGTRKNYRERERSVLAEGSGGLPDLVDALRWRWKPAAVIALCIFVGALLYIQKLPSEYDGKAIVSISPRVGTAAGADTVRVEAPKFVAFVEAPETARTVERIVGIPAATLNTAVNATVPVDTGNVSIVVR